MTQLNLDIERFRKIHPKVDHSKKQTVPINIYAVQPVKDECDVEQYLTNEDKIKKLRIELNEQMEWALQTKKDSPNFANAWDIVNEIENTIDHLKEKC